MPISILKQIMPQKKFLVRDLVKEAGVDVTEWEKTKASNPKYCYKWSFIEPGKVVVLSLWFDTMEEFGGTIIKEGNYRIDAQKYKGNEQKQKVNRTIEMDQCIRKAFYEKLPVRVIVCDGIKAASAPDIKNSSVKKRILDPRPWTVTEYNDKTGQCTITRNSE
jgi:hypothetical protein